MFYNIIPLIIIVISLIIIIFIIGRRFSQLATIDLDSIAQERYDKVKNKIIIERLKRKWQPLKTKLIFLTKPFLNRFILILKNFYEKIIKLEEEYKKDSFEKSQISVNLPQQIDNLFQKAQELFKEQNYLEAEKNYIKVIELDNKNLNAYQGLGELYLEKKDYKAAKETFRYILKLLKSKAVITNNGNGKEHSLAYCFFNLGVIYQKMEQNKPALNNFKKALELEPYNPKYLDQIIEISIILKDKKLAQNTLKTFKEVNPDNQKLSELEEKVRGL